MAEDSIPEILAEQRLGHQVPGMRGLSAHTSECMRDDLTKALQARWEESLKQRAALAPHSPVPLLDSLLAPFRDGAAAVTVPAGEPGPRRRPAREQREQGILPNSSHYDESPHPQRGMRAVQ